MKLKHLFTFTLFAFFSIACFAQERFVERLMSSLDDPIRKENGELQLSVEPTFLYTRNLEYYVNGNWDLSNQWLYRYNEESLVSETEFRSIDTENLNILDRIFYEYDEFGNVTSKISRSWNRFQNKWEPNYTFEYAYNENNLKTFELKHHYWSGSQVLLPQYRRFYAYDENGKVTLDQMDEWSSSLDWHTVSKKIQRFIFGDQVLLSENYYWRQNSQKLTGTARLEYTYDESTQNELSLIYYLWDEEEEAWYESFTTLYFFDVDANILSDTTYSAETDEIIRYHHNTYNDAGLVLRSIRFKKNDEGVFIEDYEEIRNYNTSNKLINRTTKSWDSQGNFVHSGKEEREYDNNGFVSLSAYYRWDRTLEAYKGDKKWEFENDEFGNRIVHLRYNWDALSSDWIPAYKEYCRFNSSSLPIYGATYHWDRDASDWIGSTELEIEYDDLNRVLVEVSRQWSIDDNAWVPKRRYTNIYESLKQNQSIHWSPLSEVTYGDTVLLSAIASSNLAVGFQLIQDNSSVLVKDSLFVKSTEPIILRLYQDGDDSFDRAQDIIFTINPSKALLKITADDLEIIEGETLPTLTMTFEGFLFEDGSRDIVVPQFDIEEIDVNIPGKYSIDLVSSTDPGEEASTKYEIELHSGTLTIWTKPLGLERSDFQLFPNPASSFLNIDKELDFDELVVTDLSGSVVKLSTRQKDDIYSIDNIEAGVYLVSLMKKGVRIGVVKLAIEK